MNAIIKALPMIIAYLVSYMIFMELDKKYSLIMKLDAKIKIKKSHKALFYGSSAMILIMIFGIIGIYIIDFSEMILYIFTGFIVGFALNLIRIGEKN